MGRSVLKCPFFIFVIKPLVSIFLLVFGDVAYAQRSLCPMSSRAQPSNQPCAPTFPYSASRLSFFTFFPHLPPVSFISFTRFEISLAELNVPPAFFPFFKDWPERNKMWLQQNLNTHLWGVGTRSKVYPSRCVEARSVHRNSACIE